VAILSQTLLDGAQLKPVYEGESAAFVMAVQKWRPTLLSYRSEKCQISPLYYSYGSEKSQISK